jgi:hypothetical protein
MCCSEVYGGLRWFYIPNWHQNWHQIRTRDDGEMPRLVNGQGRRNKHTQTSSLFVQPTFGMLRREPEKNGKNFLDSVE